MTERDKPRQPSNVSPPPIHKPAETNVQKEPTGFWDFCPNCSTRLQNQRCKYVCPNCHYFMSCSDFD